MKFQALTCKVLVQATMAALAHNAVRAEGGSVVQVEQHGRMPHDSQHHVAEAAGNMRPYGFFHESGRDRGALTTLQGHNEVVSPKPHEALAKRSRGGNRVGHLCGSLSSVKRPALRFARRRLCRTIFT